MTLALAYGMLIGPHALGILAALCGFLFWGQPAAQWLFGVAAFGGSAAFWTGFINVWRPRARPVYLLLNPEGVMIFSLLPLLLSWVALEVNPWSVEIGMFLGVLLALPLTQGAVRLLDRTRAASCLLSNEELLEVIRVQLDLPRIKSRLRHLFVTTATKRLLPYPFALNIKPTNREGGPKYEPDAVNPHDTGMWIAEYYDLCALADSAEALESLRLSSALPLVLAGSQTSDGDTVADGGVADNIPILPALASGAEVLIVVCLDRADGKRLLTPEGLREHVFASHTTRWLSTLSAQKSREVYQAYRHLDSGAQTGVPYELVENLPQLDGVRVYVLSPRTPLPTLDVWGLRFIFGTLNRSRCARRRWLIQGFVDTMRQLKAGRVPVVAFPELNPPT